MRHWPSTILLLAVGLAACGDDPLAPTRSVSLSFCSGTTWAGFQSEGRRWVTITNGPGDATVDATERLVVATITSGTEPELAFYYLTRDQAQATFVCSTPSGTKQLSGSVAGTSGDFTQIAMGRIAVIRSSNGGFPLSDLPDGPLDLVAVNAGNAIVRRQQNYPNAATIPVLDFSSAEAFALQVHTLAVEPTGLAGARGEMRIITNGGTNSSLTINACCTGGTIPTLPASHRQSGDLYHLLIVSGSVNNTRVVERFYDTPSDQTITLGPAPSRPIFASATSAGQLWRAEIPSQPEYPSQIQLVVYTPQPAPSSTSIAIRASKEYFGGTPARWSFTIPDLRTVDGFPAQWPMISTPAGGVVTASDAPWGFSPVQARSGDSHRSATGS